MNSQVELSVCWWPPTCFLFSHQTPIQQGDASTRKGFRDWLPCFMPPLPEHKQFKWAHAENGTTGHAEAPLLPLGLVHHQGSQAVVLLCVRQFHQHGLVKELVHANIFGQPFAPAGLHHEFARKMWGRRWFQRSQNDGLVQRVSGHDRPMMEHLCAKCLQTSEALRCDGTIPENTSTQHSITWPCVYTRRSVSKPNESMAGTNAFTM
jgi:hypothetical protein